MGSVVFCFQVHQPFRLRKYSVFDADPFYFDDQRNAEICRKVATKCYLPTTRRVLDLVRRHEGRFRVAYSLTGVVLEQFEAYVPEVIETFHELAATGCCEFLGETYHHSLASLYSRQEFLEQIEAHTRKIQSLFGQTPTTFRNTELIYDNALAHEVAGIVDASGNPRFFGMLCEGTDKHLAGRSPGVVYRPPVAGAAPNGAANNGAPGRPLAGRDGRAFGLLLKNYHLSDDIAFRFSAKGWQHWPLTAIKYAAWVQNALRDGPLVNLFMDYETFGEHQWEETGIFDFLDQLPGEVLRSGAGFATPSEALKTNAASAIFDVPEPTSWADTERDVSAWRGNPMQSSSLDEVFRLERAVKDAVGRAADPEEGRRLLSDWRRLTTSDHYYYMSTKGANDGAVHQYFSPYESPYDSYINYMNVLDNVRSRLARTGASLDDRVPALAGR